MNVKFVFVTGISGYIGGTIALKLHEAGYRVLGLVRKEADEAQVRSISTEFERRFSDKTAGAVELDCPLSRPYGRVVIDVVLLWRTCWGRSLADLAATLHTSPPIIEESIFNPANSLFSHRIFRHEQLSPNARFQTLRP
jgi:NAD(P)-dependent dehydrogenase (short-subunit alcohol dehydrogenase family)